MIENGSYEALPNGKIMRNIEISFVAISLLSFTHSAALAVDIANGERLARRWCSACHIVGTDQRPVPTVASPFASIAQRQNLDARQLSQSLLAPHPKMPERGLSRDQALDIAAYIRSLKN